MRKTRILGPRERLGEVLPVLLDLGVLHLSQAETPAPLRRVALDARQARHRKLLRTALEDLEEALARLGNPPAPPSQPREPGGAAELVRLARRLHRQLDSLAAAEARLAEERMQLARLEQFFTAFASLPDTGSLRRLRSYHLILSGAEADAVGRLGRALEQTLGEPYVLQRAALPSGDVALVLAVPSQAAEQLEELLSRHGVQDLEVPADYRGRSFEENCAAIGARIEQIDEEVARFQEERRSLAATQAAELHLARSVLQDHLLALEAFEAAAETPHAFVLEGWIPELRLELLRERLASRVGDDVVVDVVAAEEWAIEEGPVALANPQLFRPFETLTRLLPLPVYGTIDPTPFVAIFFPMFFGVILGDVGYGAVLGGLALWLRRRSPPTSLLRPLAAIAGACAVFSIVFGLVYGELFGDLGRRWLGLVPLGFSRERALLPFLVFAVGLGVVHVLLGLVLGAIVSLRHEPRRSLGRSLAALMLLLVVGALLAALNVLPAGFFRPAIVALLVMFPLVIAIEGVIGPVELLSTLSHVLSYARIMALGTASVMMAAVANDLVGAFGAVWVGVILALLFHLVNFFLGVFSPAVQSLRLQYVEFFGKFYSPGGIEYRPFRHWRPGDATTV